MKKILVVLFLLLLSSAAFGQKNLPPCDPNNLPPNCTDYFGVANWANSPLPAGAITGFTIKAAGSGYVNPVFQMTDISGTGAGAPTFTLDATGGLATVTGGGGGTSYIAPQITIVDVGAGGTLAGPTCGPPPGFATACGSGAIVLATIGAPLTAGTGIHKFVDPLPDLKGAIAVPDTITFPGSDYYVIGLQEYLPKLHTDLPATKLRGYVQLNSGTDITGTVNNVPPPPQSYLGPVILAQKNRPVRVFFKNMLPIGQGGNLFIPVDTTYMGAGAPYTDNRATLHLHGGATPWISDGTPHQWTAPGGEAGPARGDSVQFVPDMWFDPASGYALIPACQGQSSCPSVPGATNDPGPGNLTFFWTNQQGGRLMFYHDHAYGITRLNVYAGEAAGYLLYDPAEEAALLAAGAPGTLATNATQTLPDSTHLIPLVIQDKTFVPSPSELAAEDPTWTGGGFGTTPGAANPGDLWFPHVYTTNQNPADAGGANAFGRWDYGPWTLPGNQTVLLAANPQTAVSIPCTSSAFPNQAVQCPITPNPSGTPEAFMDTPVVNGKAYPVLQVAPAAYRFQILSAGNDRSLNLQWYVADPTVTTIDGRTNTEVKMLPAVQPSGAAGTLPLCTQITPITNTTLFMGLATALFDANGNPLNGTGLPAGCWPNFGAGSQAAGIPVQQTMWAADGRAGGVPDPTTAGPPWIEIGTEGGLLPAAVVIPSMPIGYEANTRSVTITNVSVHSLWLGPAERADVIVDFSKFGGQTLILYNDAPTPAPAVDSRLDYFTGDGDQTPIGGAPNTLAGFGPNTRTIMKVVVDPTVNAPNTVPFSLPALSKALPAIFAQTQPLPIVPEPTYPPASGGYSPQLTYSLISDATLTWTPIGSTNPVTYTDERKTIQELFTLDYGRMNATLGVELPLTNFLTQTTIPLGYIDPFTDVINHGDTQLWHITHNGVDTHFIHFHLFNVQVINRSGWDGTVRPPDQNELGWKDTVRMNPLEDILVALKPIQPLPPFPIRDSYRLLDVTMAAGSDCPAPSAAASPLPCSIFTDVNPANNNPLNTPNELHDFGWEYVWHCHILGHEENDMMRAIVFQVPPEAPSSLSVSGGGAGGTSLTWIDNSSSETGFTLERATDAGFTTNVFDIPVSPLSADTNGQGVTWGETVTANDTSATGTTYFYRVRAFKPDATYWSPFGTGPILTPANINSAWSNTATFGAAVSVSPTAVPFGTVPLATPSAIKTVTLTNTGGAALTFTNAITGPNAGDFVVASNACGTNLAGNSSCPIGLTFTPTLTAPESASLVITTSDPTNPMFTVLLSGTGGGLPQLTITAGTTTMKYGTTVPGITFSYNPPNPIGVTAPTCTAAVPATPPAIPAGTYQITCMGATGNYNINYVAGTLSVMPVPLTVWPSNVSMLVGSAPPVIQPLYVGFVAGDTPLTLATAPNVAPTCNAIVPNPTPPPANGPLTNSTPVGVYTSVCSGGIDPNYTFSYVNGTATVTVGVLTITAPNLTMPYGGPVPTTITPTYTSGGTAITPVAPFTPPVCSTSVTVKSPAGSYRGGVVCAGAVDPNYTISYVAGSVNVTQVPLTVTAPSPTMTYGGPMPALNPIYTGFVAGDTAANLTTQATCTTTASLTSPVGTYPVTCSGAVDPNYTITYVLPGTLTINPAPLTIAAKSTSKVYGTALTFTGTEFTPTGLLNTDTVTSVTLSSAGSAATAVVGSYPIVPSAAVGTGLSNYSITYVNGTLTVTGALLTITAKSTSKVYGAALTFIGTEFTTTGLLNTDAVTSVTLTSAGAPATATVVGSPYPIIPSAAVGSGLTNYTIIYVNGQFTVTPASLTITAKPASKIFGQTLVFAGTEFTTTGLLNGDTVTSVTLTSTGAAASATVAGSPYPIIPSVAVGGGLTNYTISYANGALIVAQANSTTTITSNLPNPAIVGQVVTVSVAVTAQYSGTPTGTVTVTANTGEKCNAIVSGQGSCTLTFFSGGTRTLTATYAGDSNFLASPVSAQATEQISNLTLSTKSLLFGDQIVGTLSAPQSVTLSNVGTTTVTISNITWSANFSDTNNCGGSLAPGRSCRINVRFAPTTTGVLTGTLTITDSDLTSPQVITLTGTGVQPAASLNPTSLTFTTPRRTPQTQSVTLQNTGAAAMTISGINFGGANPGRFSQTNNCGASLAIGATCTINVTFSSNQAGTYTATLNVNDNAPNSPQTVSLTGTAQ